VNCRSCAVCVYLSIAVPASLMAFQCFRDPFIYSHIMPSTTLIKRKKVVISMGFISVEVAASSLLIFFWLPRGLKNQIPCRRKVHYLIHFKHLLSNLLSAPPPFICLYLYISSSVTSTLLLHNAFFHYGHLL
jgi:hypothetical protein